MGKILFKFKKLASLFLIFCVLFQIMTPTIVLAENVHDCKSITLSGNPTKNGTKFEYEHGFVTITKNNLAVDTASFSVSKDDRITISLNPDDNYNAKLHNDNQGWDANLNENSYSFIVGNNPSDVDLSFTPSFDNGEPPVEAIKFDFKLNGKSFTNVSIGDQVTVPDDFNMNKLEEFYITKIAIDGGKTYSYSDGEYSYNLLDANNNRIFETWFNKRSDNYLNLRMLSHSMDILDKDIAEGKTRNDYFGFYITGINFVKSGFKGVEAATNVMPDNYDFTLWNGVDLSNTTKVNPGKVTAYYGENTINLLSKISSQISEIKLVDNGKVPSSAVDINSETRKVTVLSNYYNEIPLEIKLQDGTVGYITINRIGIFIGDLDAGNNTFYHGAAAEINGNINIDTDKFRLVGVFYHEKTTTYADYDLIVNITYDNGRTETKIAQGIGDVNNTQKNGDIIGSDYILWKGNSREEYPKKISVTAVKKGATTNSDTFGGATFGSGAGVVWNKD